MASEQSNSQPTSQPEFPPGLHPYPTQDSASDWAVAGGASSEESDTQFSMASSSERFAAGFIDVVLVGIASIVYIMMFGTKTTATRASPETGKTLSGSGMLWFVVLSLAYFFLTELYLGGSVGKLLLGLRVQTIDRTKPTPTQLAIRTILRPIDGLPYFIPNLVGFLVLQSSERRQRIGDRYARTIVVKIR